jgi:DNA-binding LacI/PurR family transcriptional regulator
VAWIGPGLAIAAILPLCVVTVTTVSSQADDVRTRYEALPAAMARAGIPLDADGPVITDNPIWLAESTRVRALALPQESPDAVLALAHRFGAKILVVREDGAKWPAVLVDGGTAALCFQEVPLSDNSGRRAQEGTALAEIHVFRIVCP